MCGGCQVHRDVWVAMGLAGDWKPSTDCLEAAHGRVTGGRGRVGTRNRHM